MLKEAWDDAQRFRRDKELNSYKYEKATVEVVPGRRN